MKLHPIKLNNKKQTGLGTSIATAIRRRIKTDETGPDGKPVYRKEPIIWDTLPANEVVDKVVQNLMRLVPGTTVTEAKAMAWVTMLEATDTEVTAMESKKRGKGNAPTATLTSASARLAR